MDSDRIREDFGNTWKRLAEGWRSLSAKAAHALTYFSPTRSDEPVEDARWGILAADVEERGDGFVIEIEAPGLAKEEIDVTVEDHRVIVTGTKRYENERKEGSMRITERAFGSFQRVIPLPETLTPVGAEATYKRGVLTLKVPKAAPPSARKISVSTG
jgi:HSP20 family protein